MSLIRKFLDNLAPRRNPEAKVVQTSWGPVSESVRLRVAQNMIEDPVCRARVEDALEKQLGSREAALREARARWPEAYL